MKTVRGFSSALGALMVLLLASMGRTENSLPVSHPEPITIRILDGKYGAPLAHVHLLFVAGYDNADLRLGLWSAEGITDGLGRANLPASLKDFAFLQVWVLKHKLCASHGRSLGVNLDRIRYQGFSTPNYCGTTVVEDAPGIFNVFAAARHRRRPPPPAPRAAESPLKKMFDNR